MEEAGIRFERRAVQLNLERVQRIVTKELLGPQDVEVEIRGRIIMSDDKIYLLSPQNDGTYDVCLKMAVKRFLHSSRSMLLQREKRAYTQSKSQ